MDYRTRMTRAFVLALLLHTLLFVVPSEWRPGHDALGLASVQEPIVLNLQQEERPLRLVDTVAPAQRPVDPDTDLIAEHASNASGLAEKAGERLAPSFERASEFDELPVPAVAGEETPAPPEVPEPKGAVDVPVPPVLETDAAEVEAPAEAVVVKEEPAAEPEPEEEPVQVAQAELTARPRQDPKKGRARPDGGAKADGFVGFEAKEHEFAAYLKDVQRRVERRWRAMIQMRYSGSSPTKVVVDCEIAPTGQLVYAKVVDRGNSGSFAPLCKEAMEAAAPFPPFPFTVPPIYRNQNLEIRWTFSFLQD
ncbi:MAG: TonB C-terminal domain-containing protein [Candidatus Hydrogenedentes bacterium]|nr:TonB C-terminal domain-containing protein [Candidatus Hydrogenedentota bacterium]